MFTRHRLVAVLGLVCVLLPAASPSRAADQPDRFIVSGASGQLGELTVKELLRRGVDPRNLILVSHTPQKLAEYAKMGAGVRYGDLYKPETLEGVYAGGTRMLLISIGGPSPTPRPLAHKAGFDAAVKAGVKHIVYTSFLGADKGDSPLIAEHRQSEDYLKASGAEWTVLRNGFYADLNLSAAIAMAKNGSTTVPANEQKTAPVMRADCAAAAAGALLNPSLSENQIFDITGPGLYNRRDLVKAVSMMTGKKIEMTEERPPSVGGAPAGAPDGPGAAGTPYVPLGPPAGTPAIVSDAVAKLSGHPAMGLQAMLEANKQQILAAASGSSNDSAVK
jgi:NAD(P)H dehydrogenase (quinone)